MEARAVDENEELLSEIGARSAQIHAATAQVAKLAAAYDSSRAWAHMGARSCAHWLTITTGFDLRTSGDLVRIGHAIQELPAIAAAFEDGRLSFDKVRVVTLVATADDEPMWLQLALHASGAQLTRICRSVRRVVDRDRHTGDTELARRCVRRWWRDDGMLELVALLPREEGAVVMAAIDAVSKDLVTERRSPENESRTLGSELRREVVEADAFVRICEQHLSATSPEPVVAPTRQVVIHVDESALREGDVYGRCHIEDGPWISPDAALWMACDADTVTITEREGLPIDVGRAHRVITPRLRLALQARDKGCRYPGCGAPAKRCEGHHWRHWPDGGRTELRNLLLLCRFHHRRHHEGKFSIRKTGPGQFVFERADGTPIGAAQPAQAGGPLPWSDAFTPEAPAAISRGERYNHHYAVSVLADAAIRAREGPALNTA